jgi:hypothetical protein
MPPRVFRISVQQSLVNDIPRVFRTESSRHTSVAVTALASKDESSVFSKLFRVFIVDSRGIGDLVEPREELLHTLGVEGAVLLSGAHDEVGCS